MKRLALLLAVVALFAPACDDDDDPVNPSTVLPLRFTADLKASNEVPPVTNADAAATGRMTVTFTVARDAVLNITAVTSSDFVVDMAGFPAGTVLVGAHIHEAPAGQTAPIYIDTGLKSGEVTLGLGSGSFAKTLTSGVSVEQVQNMAKNPSGYYFNVHTPLNPTGAIRAQLTLVQ